MSAAIPLPLREREGTRQAGRVRGLAQDKARRGKSPLPAPLLRNGPLPLPRGEREGQATSNKRPRHHHSPSAIAALCRISSAAREWPTAIWCARLNHISVELSAKIGFSPEPAERNGGGRLSERRRVGAWIWNSTRSRQPF